MKSQRQAKILEIVAKEKKTLSELVSELPVYYASKMKILSQVRQYLEVLL